MTNTDQKQEDEVLRRMLVTKPTPHKPLGTRQDKSANGKAQGRKQGRSK